MEIAKLYSQRSTCFKKHVGCVIVLDNRIISTGYNGVLPGIDPMDGLDEKSNTHTVHAEANAIAFCAKFGISTNGCTLYTTLSPCEKCAEIIIQAGIRKVIFSELYRETKGIELLKKLKIEVSQLQ